MPITANVTNEQITASVGETQIDVTVSGGVGPTGAAGASSWNDITGKPSEFAPSAHAASHSLNGDDELEIEGDQVRIAVDSENASTLGQGTVAATFLHTANATGLPTALPIATANARGAVRIGSGVSIDGNGVISVSTNYAAASHAHGSITSAGAIGTTSGLVLKTGTSGVIEALAQGTAGQVLVVNSGATAMEWKTLAAADVGAAAVSHAHSVADIQVGTGTAGQVLTVNSGATALVWATPTTYTLPQATGSTLGGITVSTGLSVASGALSVSYGTSSGTACQGNDARLSDARTPTAHNQAWSTITSTPTTRSGYGITDSQKTITSGTAAPTGGSDGDIYLQYT